MYHFSDISWLFAKNKRCHWCDSCVKHEFKDLSSNLFEDHALAYREHGFIRGVGSAMYNFWMSTLSQYTTFLSHPKNGKKIREN